jgi:hypothetical protein
MGGKCETITGHLAKYLTGGGGGGGETVPVSEF